MQIEPGSFRDPAGYVFRDEAGMLSRAVSKSYKADYDHLMHSGLYDKLTNEKLLVSHKEITPTGSSLIYKYLQPAEITPVSFPYEWCFGQLKDAALLTLDVLLSALDYGMVLKDASSFNVLLKPDGKPVFIDTLSFELYDGNSPWVAYRQFCQHYLAPLALMSHGAPSANKLLMSHMDGVPLSAASKLLPTNSYFKLGLLIHIHVHSRINNAAAKPSASHSKHTNGVRTLKTLALNLKSTISGLKWLPEGTEWASYYTNTNYSDASMQHKVQLVQEALSSISYAYAWDVGANSGRFSRIAAQNAKVVVASDYDPAAIEQLHKQIKQTNTLNILPLVIDITNPSPAIGWNNVERASLLNRINSELILALALIHHLVITHNIPLPYIVKIFAAKCRYLLIEFIPKEDSQVQQMLVGRKDIYVEYNQASFEEVFASSFACLSKSEITGTLRTLYLFEQKNAPTS